MPEIVTGVPGSFCWAELATSASRPGREFYTALFPWTATDLSLTSADGTTVIGYWMLTLGDRPAASLYELLGEQQERGVPSHWLAFVAAEDAQRTAHEAERLGGLVLVRPVDVRGFGTLAVIEDPTGARFALWQPGAHAGFGVVSEPGAAAWFELRTRDPDSAAAFYGGLFGWTRAAASGAGAPYALLQLGGRPVAGLTEPPPELGDVPAHWAPFFSVEDCAAACARVEAVGGAVRVAPRALDDLGRFAAVEDPQGAGFSLLEPAAGP